VLLTLENCLEALGACLFATAGRTIARRLLGALLGCRFGLRLRQFLRCRWSLRGLPLVFYQHHDFSFQLRIKLG
jgi:hypothetical protein